MKKVSLALKTVDCLLPMIKFQLLTKLELKKTWLCRGEFDRFSDTDTVDKTGYNIKEHNHFVLYNEMPTLGQISVTHGFPDDQANSVTKPCAIKLYSDTGWIMDSHMQHWNTRNSPMAFKKHHCWSWRASSAEKSTCESLRGPKFKSQHPSHVAHNHLWL